MEYINLKNYLKIGLTAIFCSFLMTVAKSQSPPTLGTAEPFVLFTAVGAFNNTGASAITGDIGTDDGAFSLGAAVLVGNVHVEDGVSETAADDVASAYMYLAALGGGSVISSNLNGQVLTPGLYTIGSAASLSTTLTLDGEGDSTAVFILKINGALTTAALSNIALINNASLCNVYWQINGQLQVGEGSTFQGTVIANGAIILLEGSTLLGQGLTQAGAISVSTSMVTIGISPVASVIVPDGPLNFCEGDSVVLSGNVGGTWNVGGTAPSLKVFTAGTYYVMNTTACGTVISNLMTITTFSIIPTITADGPTSFCTGDTVILTASPSTGYLWSTGATTQSIIVTTSGSYTVTTQDGCGNGVSEPVDVTVSQDIRPVITANGPTTFCLGESVTLTATLSASYLWSTGATSRSILVTTSGIYTVTTPDACISAPMTIIVDSTPDCGVMEPIPTMGQWSLIMLFLLFAISGTLYMRGKLSKGSIYTTLE
ncbi:MAG TPA: ice-binding family protein [Saprospiraceae bacterium]|nr:ice-binding family protein [Saprospiraceae bacterium]